MYKRISINAVNYERSAFWERWVVGAQKAGTAGNMAQYALCYQYRNNDGSEELVFIQNVDLETAINI